MIDIQYIHFYTLRTLIFILFSAELNFEFTFKLCNPGLYFRIGNFRANKALSKWLKNAVKCKKIYILYVYV